MCARRRFNDFDVTDRKFMHVFCHKCQFRGVIDAMPTSSETQPVCARCATTLEAVSVKSERQPAEQSTGFESTGFELVSDCTAAGRPGIGIERPVRDFLDVFEAQHATSSHQQVSELSPLVADAIPAAPLDVTPPVKAAAPLAEEVPAARAVPTKPLEHKPSPRPQASRWSLSLLNPFRPRPGRRVFVNRDKFFLLRISPVVALSCVLAYLSLTSLDDLWARPTEKTDKVSQSQQSTSAAAAQRPPTSDASLPSGKEEALLTAPEGVAPTGYAEETTSEAAEDDAAADEGAGELADEAAHEGPEEEGGFTVQVGSYADSEQANAHCASLNLAGIESWMVKAQIPGRGTWYRVHAGRFVSREEAARFGAQLQADRAVQNYIVTASETP
jgi:cell division septation protein DedD